MEVVRQLLQARGLAPIHLLVPFRVVAHQHFAKGRVELFDVPAELLAVLEVELVLAALLRGTGGNEPLLVSVVQNGRTKLLVHEDAGVILRYSVRDGGLEAVVNHLLDGGNLHDLLGAKLALPTEHVFRERGAVVEGQHIQGLVITNRHDVFLSGLDLCVVYRSRFTLVAAACSST